MSLRSRILFSSRHQFNTPLQDDECNSLIDNENKLPGDNNSACSINTLKTEMKPILQGLCANNDEAVICGHFNINLLKINGEAHFSEFLDTMLGHTFYPKIMLPTRLNRSSGAILIHNIYYKLSSQAVTSSAGITFDELSDHYPYSLSLGCPNTKQSKPQDELNKQLMILNQWKIF